ncbi:MULTISPECIES: hypothetical protein [unclassified Methylobacterium]|jgi:hypothetical protein|uniref:hypothetical protein n=1 Tax=unclassified Methylobacterium TaxID=2615210 RepID=UPI001353B010|nr:hypothetical protein [Methylobacterium sp. 2A]MWV22838.1 hypothetical protein [Methylobacterium sp. 2A]
MDAIETTASPRDADGRDALQRDAETVALWLALDADRRARDERTERLRAMRLIGGEDDSA